MDMHELEELLHQPQYKAPEGFTHQVMKKIYTHQKNRQAAERFYKAGVSLIAASLITLFINMTPIMDILIEKGTNQMKFPSEVVNPYRAAGSIEYITLKIDSIMLKPFELLTEQFVKEDLSYDE